MYESPAPTAVHTLRNHAFRQLWIGGAISSIGDQFYFVALPWLILQITGSSIALGTVTMTAAIPRAVLLLIGGALTDRISPRRIMMVTATCRALLVAAVSALLWQHCRKLWPLYLLALGFGTADAFAIPAAQTFLPSLVAREQLAAANSISQSTAQLTTMVAPAPAGLFLKAFGTAWAFFVDAVSFLFILVALWRLPDPPASGTTGTARRNMVQAIADGMRFVGKDAALRSLMLVLSVLNFAITGPAGVGIAYLAKQQLGSATAFGLLMSAMATGGLAGSLLAGLVARQRRGLWMLGLCSVIGICLWTFGQMQHMASMAVLLALIGGSVAFVNVQLIAWFQQRIEPAMMGRVMSLLMFSAVGLMPFSLAITGFSIHWSAAGTFLVSGALVLLVTLFAAANRPVREID